MKRILKIMTLSLLPLATVAQQTEKDSLLSILNQHKGDTTEVNTLAYLSKQYPNPDSMAYYTQLAFKLTKKINYKKGEAHCLLITADMNSSLGNYSEAIKNDLEALSIYKTLHDRVGIATAHLGLQGLYYNVGDYRTALNYSIPGEQIAKANNVKGLLLFPGHHLAPLFDSEIAQVYVLMNQLDSALFYIQRSIDQKELFYGTEWNFPIYLRATIQTMRGQYEDALINFRKAYPLAIQNDFRRDTLQIFAGLSTLFRRMGQYDSSLHYAHTVVYGWSNESEYKNLAEALNNLAQIYKLKGKADSSLKYVELAQTIKDSIFTNEKSREIQKVTFAENLKQQQLIADQLEYRNKVQLYSFIGGALILVLVVLILWRSRLQQKKAKIKIQQAYTELKATQTQLIQSEKMASLGELTAGIAHEIQNPLNFVNNFSEVNDELLKELKAEAEKGNLEEVKTIANDIAFNSEKINHHGKRADGIVKNMLQHSRTSSGQKEPTDINALCDEYLRLSYHGLRAKDKSFNASMKTDYDETIGKVSIIPQDIGRVILNLINNAFYAVDEKKKQLGDGYEPTISVNTKKLNSKVEIKIADNGNGIPQKIIDKIFQPFFTTKPTGQGTGLGLSLSYDIVKAHGGELIVETKEGEGTEFIIVL